jgi:hypothetical protein
MRLTGLGKVHLETSGRALPHVDIPAIRDCIGLRESLRKKVGAMRDKKRVHDLDFDESGDTEGSEEMADMG